MHEIFIVSPSVVPPSLQLWREALAARGIISSQAIELPDEGLIWDRCIVRCAGGDLELSFTSGQGLPVEATSEWLAWAARGLDEGQQQLVQGPSSTLRLRAPERLQGQEGARFCMALSGELAILTDGLLVDMEAQRFRTPHEALELARGGLDARTWVSVHAEASDEGDLDLHTHGMRRLGGDDLEMGGVPPQLLPLGVRVLNELAQHQLLGHRLRNGESVMIDDELSFALSHTAKFTDHVQNRVLALVDPSDAPHRDACRPAATLAQCALEAVEESVAAGEGTQAMEWLDIAIRLTPLRSELHEARAQLVRRLGER